MRNVRSWRLSAAEILPYLTALILAVGLKYHYSRAATDDLLWILLPTSALVEAVTGLPFVYGAAAGFINAENGIAIAPACGGVNFLIIAFGMSFFSFAHLNRGWRQKWLWLAVTLFCSYVVTIGVNGCRIYISIQSITHGFHFGWLTPERIHRIEGVGVYFFFLAIFYLAMKRVAGAIGQEMSTSVTQTSRRQTFVALTPLSWYLLVTLAIPVLTGNCREEGMKFVEHGAVVLLSCAAVILLLHGLRRLIRPVVMVRENQREG